MIEVSELTKRFGRRTAVDRLSFTVKPGRVTGFLGPNGAGKSTTMRMVLGLDRPDRGSARVLGRPYDRIAEPLRHVGALLDAGAMHPGLAARDHLIALARANRLGAARVDTVLERVGLTDVGRRRIGGFSLGMRQRLGIAAALLGEPEVLLFDEPVNGLDPEGIRWIRDLMRAEAATGRTVLVSSHLMSEMQLTADHVLVIGRGRLILESSMADLAERFRRDVLVAAADPVAAESAFTEAGGVVAPDPEGMSVTGLTAERLGEIALRHGITLHRLTPRSASLEDSYLQLTADAVEFRTGEES
ncbi:ABC-2 type transport system ATP-binding protein [Stackebrandtia albiflava]|uniref:ABC-2 type transport system ATP-binding protein n=1 Tax=Stackebrandtia albiflava TaxID=406432 RepID=A0A562V0V1_9ACTN|nr:ABC transporter ATP-binding protein [Stackebrandtia albiflava]TWJ11442.1 ABC-2 type transport system ATP-binding protein [Stackebrandtia albiflava]